jgi:Domain of unknown function (DUF4411)
LLYLLDADTLITGDRRAYPLKRFPIFWEWLRYQGAAGTVKIPLEQFEEVTTGRGDLVDWLLLDETRSALLFDQEADPALVADVTLRGYGNLNEDEIELVGRDPFLISYAIAAVGDRTVVSFEVSAPGKRRARRKIPDVCRSLGVPCCTLFEMIAALDFTTDWRP